MQNKNQHSPSAAKSKGVALEGLRNSLEIVVWPSPCSLIGMGWNLGNFCKKKVSEKVKTNTRGALETNLHFLGAGSWYLIFLVGAFQSETKSSKGTLRSENIKSSFQEFCLVLPPLLCKAPSPLAHHKG